MKSINIANVRWCSGALAGLVLLLPAIGSAQEQGVASAPSSSAARAAAMVRAYWTAERMQTARPMPVPTVAMAAGAKPLRAAPPHALPGWAPGWEPGSGPQPKADTVYWMSEEDYVASEAAKLEPQHGAEPMNPRDGPYAPFQRWTWSGKYITYPASTIGKLFFTLPGQGNFVCSASVIGRSTLATAGHCVSDGAGGWATNMLFCPSFRRVGGGAPHPGRGCWVGVTQTTSSAWHFNSDFDRDYACIVTAETGTVRNNRIGDTTGWTGRAWNWYGVMEMAFGYPAAPPFPGYNIITAASPDWYTHDWGNDTNQYAKFIGNDSTGGSSGGPWWLGLRHPGLEYADTDGNNNTDPGQPGGPYINGVNSHKRCAGGTCQSPPTTTAGVFWQEMGSSAFRNTAGDGGESEDVFAVCLAHANNS